MIYLEETESEGSRLEGESILPCTGCLVVVLVWYVSNSVWRRGKNEKNTLVS